MIRWGTYLSFFAPLVLIKSFFFPFVVPKTIFFRIVIDIVFIFYVLLAVSNPKYRPRITPLTITVLVFILVLVLTSIAGVSFSKSFWSVFERMTGLLTFFHLFAFYIVLTSVFQKRRDWDWILFVSVLVGVFMSMFVFTANEAASRGGGTLGNTSFLSACLIFCIFFAIIQLFTKEGIGWKIFYSASLIVFFIATFFNIEPTRGAIGALAGGILVLVLGYLFFHYWISRGGLSKRAIFILASVFVLLCLGFSQTSIFKGELQKISEMGSFQSRKIVWDIAIEGWKERPLLGWGMENFNIPFAKYFNPELPLTHDMWYDRAHNVIIDTLVMTGVIGLLSYLSLFIVAIIGLLMVAPRVKEKKNLLFPVGMIALLATYFAQNFWVFDMISSYIVFFLSLAFIDFLISPRKEESSGKPVFKRNDYLSLVFGTIMMALTLWAFYFGNIQVARASMLTVEGLYTSFDESIESFQKAISASPISRFEVPEQISTRMVALGSENLENKELLQKGFALAENELKISIEQNPLDYRMRLFLGRYYDNLYQFTGSSTDLDLAEEVLNKAMELSPRNQQTFWSLGQTKIFQGDYDKAIELMQRSVDLEPKFANSHWYLGLTYKIAGKFDLAAKEIETAAQLGDPWKQDIEDVKQAIDIYKELSDGQKLADLYEIGAGLSVQDTTTFAAMLAGMADSNAKIGNREKAKLAAEKLMEIRPDLATSVKSFLKELGY